MLLHVAAIFLVRVICLFLYLLGHQCEASNKCNKVQGAEFKILGDFLDSSIQDLALESKKSSRILNSCNLTLLNSSIYLDIGVVCKHVAQQECTTTASPLDLAPAQCIPNT